MNHHKHSISKRILLVDDMPASNRILRSRLKEEKYDVLFERSLDDAYEVITNKENLIDLLISDLYLPATSRYKAELENKYLDFVTLITFNHGQLLGALAKENKIPYLYYTSEKRFYNGSDTDNRVCEKSMKIDDVLNKINELLQK